MGRRYDGKVVWITGGGSGIGRACAERFAAEGATVAVSGRRQDKLDAVVSAITDAGGTALAIPCDVTDEEAVAAAVAQVVEQAGRLDVVMANAGFGVVGRAHELDDATWRRQFDVNVFGLLNTVRQAVPELEKTAGQVVLVGSVAAFLVPPKNGAYAASKAAVRAIGESLSHDLGKVGVHCTTIHPGFVTSEIAQVDNEGQHDPSKDDKRPAKLMWEADDAARVMVNAIHARKTEFVFTGHGRFAHALARFAPGLARTIVGRM